jgi:O-antigen ligase
MQPTVRFPAFIEGVCLLLLITAFGLIEVLIGGTRMIFSLPTYALLGVIGLLTLFVLRVPKPTPSQACLVATALFFAYIIGRAVLSPAPYIARGDLYSVLGGLVVYLFVAFVFTSGKQRMSFVVFLLLIGIAHAFIGAVQFRDGNNFMPISWLQRFDYESRASGFYICPNHLAGYLEVVAILGLSIVCWSRWPVWSKMLIAYGVAICYVALILTGSRGGYLSTGTSLLVFALLSLLVLRRASGGLFWKVGGAGAAAVVLVGFVVVLGVGKSRFLTGRAQNTFDTTNMRLELWKAALEQWHLNPIFGTGSGTYLFYGRQFRSENMQMDPVWVHNDYLQLLAEYGLVGFVGMLLFVGVHLWRGGYSFRRLGPKRVAVSPRLLSNALALNVGALAAVSSYLVHSVVDFNLHIPANLLLMAFVVGLLANDGVVRGDSLPAVTPRAQIWWRMALPVLAAVLLAQSARLLPSEYFAERSRAAMRDGHCVASINFAHRGIAWDPQNPDLHFYLGLARQGQGDRMEDERARRSFYGDAVKAFEQARAILPQEKLYAVELATALDAVGRFEDAERVFSEALQLDPRAVCLRKSYEGHLRLWAGTGTAADAPAEPIP